MKNGKIVSIFYYKYAGKYLINYKSSDGKHSRKATEAELTAEEKHFLASCRKNGAMFSCVNLSVYA